MTQIQERARSEQTMSATTELSYCEALNAAQFQAMELDSGVFVFGLGVDRTGAVFGSTKGLVEHFGEKRVFDTPTSEHALTALAAGAANSGLRPVLVHQRIDFMLHSMDQIVNWISLWQFKSGGRSRMPLVIRAIVGKGWGQGPQHAKSLHPLFAHLPGMQVVMPSSPAEAKGLLLASIFSNSPTVFIEGRSLYSMKEQVPNAPYFIRLGKASICTAGTDVTLVSFGSMMPAALEAAIEARKIDINVEVVDLRTVAPLDIETVCASVEKTGRLVVAESGWGRYGVAGEIISTVAERLTPTLKAAPKRVTWPDSHVPMSAPLEEKFYPTASTILGALKDVCGP
ncbi:MAG: alpha-ketoacid dehydrogenase subunit beta [Rhodospirillaceae bacterium]|nr:alpha-ketoacid dehydrogenase subunit beta [Rhodospirillaceae bacterium]